MTEIWTIMVVAISTSGSFLGMEQFRGEGDLAEGVYFSKSLHCESKLKRLFGQFDYNGQISQLYYLPNQQLSLNSNFLNQKKIYSCVKLSRSDSFAIE